MERVVDLAKIEAAVVDCCDWRTALEKERTVDGTMTVDCCDSHAAVERGTLVDLAIAVVDRDH